MSDETRPPLLTPVGGVGRRSPVRIGADRGRDADRARDADRGRDPGPVRDIHRVASISLHTSPLEQPGTGDAGGMNVYVAQTARRLAARGVEVEIFTRSTSSDLPPVVELAPGVLVRHVVAGPFEGLAKNDLPGQMCSFAAGVMRAEAGRDQGYYDLIHSHYWLSGQVGYLAKDRWGVPMVHSAHTLAKVKNAYMAAGDAPEPSGRLIGEDQVVTESDRLIANTAAEAADLMSLYGARRDRIDVVAPGVDTDVFVPGSKAAARARLGMAADEVVIAFAGRIQPLKAPDVLIRAAGVLQSRYPHVPWRIVVVGGVSGSGWAATESLAELAGAVGIGERVTFLPPQPPEQLATVFRAADLVAVPSYNESFGLVALEAQAAGTPVVAAAVGGLVVAVRDGITGSLVRGHDPVVWAEALAGIATQPEVLRGLGISARIHAERFSWEATVDGLLSSYRRALQDSRAEHRPTGLIRAGREDFRSTGSPGLSRFAR
ncbi:D-inositol-3-phosphate glycosyltransferase [Nakamurella silvestris]|nr:D-inositol-3-phosphate glycosyltransferase [Nakamurella silvestris]